MKQTYSNSNTKLIFAICALVFLVLILLIIIGEMKGM